MKVWLVVPVALMACGSSIDVGNGGGADGGGSGSDAAPSEGGGSGGLDSGALAPPPAGPFACDGQQGQCRCTVASTRSGACSPQSIGPAHCCGTSTSCNCDSDRILCATQTNGDCLCNTNSAGGVAIVDACPKVQNQHCCRQLGSNGCYCTARACNQTELEVDTCTPANATLNCIAPAVAVTACQ